MRRRHDAGLADVEASGTLQKSNRRRSASCRYLPNFYYGALMLVFGLEIALDWLVFSRRRFTRGEYVLTLSVFALIMAAIAKFEVTGLEIGIAVGVLVCAVHFAVEYSKVQVKAAAAVSSTSACVRPTHQHNALALFHFHLCAAAPR
jgi:MFS superfamily sulfate permease-like transporter